MKERKNWLEWLVFFISLGLVGATLVGIFQWGERGGEVPLPPVLRLEAPRLSGGQYLVKVVADNQDHQTLQSVRIEVSSGANRAELEIDYLPARSQESGWVVLGHQPGSSETPRARVLSFRTR